jgi:hypothetical protein
MYCRSKLIRMPIEVCIKSRDYGDVYTGSIFHLRHQILARVLSNSNKMFFQSALLINAALLKTYMSQRRE